MLNTSDRYILRELSLSFAATIIVLMGMVLSYRLARFLNQAAQGLLSQEAIWTLLGLQAVRFLVILIPLATLLAIMLALGRLYRDNEMTALTACGLGPWDFYRPILWFALPLAMLMMALSLYLVPQSQQLHYALRDQARKEAELNVFTPGTFREVNYGQHVIYIGALSENMQQINQVFVRSLLPNGVAVVTAEKGRQRIDLEQGIRYLVLENGFRFQQQTAAQRNAAQRNAAQRNAAQRNAAQRNVYDMVQFQTLEFKLDSTPTERAQQPQETLPTSALLNSTDPKLQAELQQRFSGPLSLLIIALMAPLLAHSNPREGRYGRVVAALLVYTIYINLLGVATAWLERERLSSALGLWWVHGIFLFLTALLWWRLYAPHKRAIKQAA